MNCIKETFNGMRIRVTYKCGHVETELSKTDAETKERRRIAASMVCHCCTSFELRKQMAKIEADPITLQLAVRRREVMDRLVQRFGQLRTH
jgi:hypothetical protein